MPNHKDPSPPAYQPEVQRSAFSVQRSPSVSFKTIGCRLNQAETDQIEEQFCKAGYEIVATESECDVAVINTCTITHGAERDSARWARRLRRKGAKVVILAGCAVEHNGAELKTKTGADIIATQAQKKHLLDLIQQTDQRSVTRNRQQPLPVHRSSFTVHRSSHTRANIKAQDGCNFRCSYCIVPDTRGKPYSLPLNTVINDIQKKADEGYREIIITGANIGCYNDNGKILIDLLEKAATVQGIERIRISSIESTTTERAVIDFMAASSKLCNFLHLPLQSGDDQTLKLMRRKYTSTQYRNTVEYAVAKIPNLGLGADIIVGFPGETEESFKNTLNLVKELPFTNLHIFSYSKRSGTPAANMPDQIDETTKKERSAQLISLGNAKRNKFAKSFIGKNVSVLIEKINESGIASGWTEEYLHAELDAKNVSKNQIITLIPSSTDNDILKC